MKVLRNYKIMNNLKKLIKKGTLPKPKELFTFFFDIEYQSYKISQADLSIYVKKEISPVYPASYTISVNDPEFKILDAQKTPNCHLTEKNTALAQRLFDRLSRYYRTGR